MENTGKLNREEIRIQGLLDGYLKRQSATALATPQNHLDEDSLAAFVEGNLSERESKPIVSHLVDCSFCRHVTAELVRLDLAFADEPVHTLAPENQPSKIADVLNNLLARIFGTNDSAVFAHEDKAEESEENKEDK